MTPRLHARPAALLALCASTLVSLAACDAAVQPPVGANGSATTGSTTTNSTTTSSTTTNSTTAGSATTSSAATNSTTNSPAVTSSTISNAAATDSRPSADAGGATPPAKAPPSGVDAAPPQATQPAGAKPDRSKFGPLVAVFEQPSGVFRVDLATRETPRLCANFVNLCERGYYDGRTWGDFSTVVRQTGAGSLDAEPAYTLPREFAPKLLFDVGGNLCMSNTSEDASARARSTRIFVTVKPQDRWNLVYPVFGRVSTGLDVAQRLAPGETISRVRIEGDTAPIKAAYAAEIAQWNKAIDAAEPSRAKR